MISYVLIPSSKNDGEDGETVPGWNEGVFYKQDEGSSGSVMIPNLTTVP